MDPDNIILKQECIFADPEGLQYAFCYYPYYQGNLLLELRELLSKMISMVDYEDEQAMRLVYELHAGLQEENATIDTMLKIYEKNAGDRLPKIQKVLPPEELISGIHPRTVIKPDGQKILLPQALEQQSIQNLPEIRNTDESSFLEKVKYYLKGHSFMEILEDLNNRELLQKINQCGRIAELPEPF